LNGTNLLPVEGAVGEPMLQIPEAGSILEVPKRAVARNTLKLRIVHHQLQSCRARAAAMRHFAKRNPRSGHSWYEFLARPATLLRWQDRVVAMGPKAPVKKTI
jgi:hypothetical protein